MKPDNLLLTRVNLSWTDSSTSVNGYTLQRATNSVFTANLVTTPVTSNTIATSNITALGTDVPSLSRHDHYRRQHLRA